MVAHSDIMVIWLTPTSELAMTRPESKSVSKTNASILQFNAYGVGQRVASVLYCMNRGFAPKSGAFVMLSHSLLAVLRGGLIRTGGQGYDDAVAVAMQWLGYTDWNMVIDDAHKLILKDELLRGSANLQGVE
jgi:hypothetical protein